MCSLEWIQEGFALGGLKSQTTHLFFSSDQLTPHQSLLEARPNAEFHQQDVKLALSNWFTTALGPWYVSNNPWPFTLHCMRLWRLNFSKYMKISTSDIYSNHVCQVCFLMVFLSGCNSSVQSVYGHIWTHPQKRSKPSDPKVFPRKM